MLHHLKTRQDARVASRSEDPERTHFVKRALLWLYLRRRRRKAIADLESLSDHLLADIGVSRNEFPRVVDALLSGAAGAATQPVARVEEPRDPLRWAA